MASDDTAFVLGGGGQLGAHEVWMLRALLERGDDVLVAVSRWTARLDETGWGETALQLPDGSWTDRLTGRRFEGLVDAADLYADLPVVLMENTHG